MNKLILFVFVSIVFSVLVVTGPQRVFAGGGRIDFSSSDGAVNGSPASVKVVVFQQGTTQFSVGEQGTFSFQNPQSGQSCSTPNNTTNTNGEIAGSCTSSIAGEFTIVFKLTSGEESTKAVRFTAPPQTLSGSYKLETSHNNITFSNSWNAGYSVGVYLKDNSSNEVIVNQGEIEYEWVSSNPSIVKIRTVTAQCWSPVEPPCPRTRGEFEGYQPGSTNVVVTAKKGGQTIASASINMTVTQSNDNPRYTAPATAATPTPTSTPASSNNATTKGPTATPVKKNSTISPTPLNTSPTQTPLSPVVTLTVTPVSDQSTESVSSLTPSDNSLSKKMSIPWELILILSGVLCGIGLPVGWLILESNPKLKAKVYDRAKKLKHALKMKLKRKKN